MLPVRGGGGTRFKALEAMAAGLPLASTPLGMEGLFVLEPDTSSDDHGRYSYYYSEQAFAATGAASHYVQEHASRYALKHTVRGLHFQKPPHAQHKVVRVTRD